MSSTVSSQLSSIQSISQKEKAQAYLSLLSTALSNPDPASVARDVHAILADALTASSTAGQVVQRQVLSSFADRLKEGAVADAELKKRIVEDAIGTAQSSGGAAALEEQVRQSFKALRVRIKFI